MCWGKVLLRKRLCYPLQLCWCGQRRAQGAGSGFTTRKDRAGTRTAPRPVSKGPANVFSVLDEDADGSGEHDVKTLSCVEPHCRGLTTVLHPETGESCTTCEITWA